MPLGEIKRNEILDLIVTYCNARKGVAGNPPSKPLRSKLMSAVVNDPWDATFIDRVDNASRQDLVDLYMVCSSDLQRHNVSFQASNYLSINCLMMLCAAKMASLIKGGDEQRYIG